MQGSSRVLVAYRTEHYRAAVVHNVEWSDVCLEVGCHTGGWDREAGVRPAGPAHLGSVAESIRSLQTQYLVGADEGS